MNWLGIQKIGVTIKNGHMYMPWGGAWNYGEVSIKAYELDENWNYVSNNYHRLWYIQRGTDRDIDADIDNGAWIWWNPNHHYRGISLVYVEAGQAPDPQHASTIDLGEGHAAI